MCCNTLFDCEVSLVAEDSHVIFDFQEGFPKLGVLFAFLFKLFYLAFIFIETGKTSSSEYIALSCEGSHPIVDVLAELIDEAFEILSLCK